MEISWVNTIFQQTDEVGNTDSPRCLTTNKGKELKREITNIITKHKDNDKVIILLAYCLELYDSKEYGQEIEKIVKKYCKDCEQKTLYLGVLFAI